MDNVADVLTAQRGTSPLTQYNGNGPVTADLNSDKLHQLIAQLKSLLADLPPELAALLMGMLQDAESLLGGGSPIDIAIMIERLQAAIQTLLELLMQLQQAGLDAAQLQALLRGVALQLDSEMRSSLAALLQKLRKIAAGDSLKGIDEVCLGSLDGSNRVEPSPTNVIQSLQHLISLAVARPVTPGDPAQAALFQEYQPQTGLDTLLP